MLCVLSLIKIIISLQESSTHQLLIEEVYTCVCVYGVLLLHIYFHGIVCNGDSVSSSLQKKDEDLKVEELVWICVRLELKLRLGFIVLLVMVRILDISI